MGSTTCHPIVFFFFFAAAGQLMCGVPLHSPCSVGKAGVCHPALTDTDDNHTRTGTNASTNNNNNNSDNDKVNDCPPC